MTSKDYQKLFDQEYIIAESAVSDVETIEDYYITQERIDGLKFMLGNFEVFSDKPDQEFMNSAVKDVKELYKLLDETAQEQGLSI